VPTKIVVGGHSRNIGKTSVVDEIISAFRDRDWTAIKITQFGHGICSINGKACHCSTEEHRYVIQEEKDRSGRTDTSRFLTAGAQKSLWVRTKQGMLFEAMPELRQIIQADPNVIIESNSILRFFKPDVYLVVLDYSISDFKATSRRYLDLADAYLVNKNKLADPSWENISLKPLRHKPVFEFSPQPYLSHEVVSFLETKLALNERN
jgi:molybdopterin-guanine dinucleotide biosynthesis protein